MQALGLVWGNLNTLATDLEEVRDDIAEPTQFGAKLLLDHWRAQRARGGFVVRRDVPSRALSSVLRNLALFEPIDAKADFRVRVAGTVLMRRFGRDITGLKLSEIGTPQSIQLQRASMVNVIAEATPSVVDVKLVRDTRVFLHFEVVRLPVWSPDRGSTWVLDGLFCFDWS